MKRLIISHGDKGGVGKSIYAMLAVDYLLSKGLDVAVVEGDIQIGDVAKRYDGVDGVTSFNVDLDKSGRDAENSIAVLFKHIEKMGCENVVINAPANAKKALDTNAELILPVAQDLEFEVCVAWMVGIEEASAEMSEKSIICEMADRKIAVVNRHESEYDADFAWFTQPQYKKAWEKSGGMIGEIPELASRVAVVLKSHKNRSLASLAGVDSPLMSVERQVFKNWLKKSWASAVAPLIDGGE
ncbi:hypothetical protein A6M27_10750 [Acidithiobacillus thiooxidans]|uniref:CobQ/CobB/MinD/ParA nucleotide binding domain-containing protein n=1 Tax=Acidithiobacillus thiooxidans TaxID=930 RepID=A0A1C2I797_ACITH|nr:hypothetical protein [Acidithiobacillus thiooxidans]OCX68704.1 hypothetical protein A6O24_19445 [Acidithiobacillus thiooxidans]OCX71830.1 hypothetical protein A6P07_11215 [Acidithiobacillus thiooxidans]OCX76810.1 hypothetical protein A6O26_20725 [Acidithiobacillus thiooxidans]OCX87154.1 hypothetical protein A6M27_10750 [Acidithiobacillus thiooxidans]OFC49621.1 hypothetical protein BAE47_04670 [Acidithiobacillus thiooxidans]